MARDDGYPDYINRYRGSSPRELYEAHQRLSNEMGPLRARLGNEQIRESMSDEQFNAAITEIERLDAEREHVNQRLAEHARLADAVSRGQLDDPNVVEWGGPGGSRGQDAPPVAGVFGEARRAIDTAVRSAGLPDHAAERVTALVEQGSVRSRTAAAQWAVVTGSDAYRTAFSKLLADPERGHLLWGEPERAAFQAVQEYRAMSLTDASGGYMVPFTLDPAVLLTSAGSVDPLRRISRVVQTATDQWQGVTSAGVTAEWKAEAAQVADATPTLAPAPIPVHFGDAFVAYSFEIGMDAVNFTQEVTQLLVDAADQLMAAAYMNGSGVGQPTGLVTSLGAPQRIAAGTADVVNAADAVALQNALPPRFQPRAQWCANLATINRLASIETTNGALRFPEVASGQLLRKPLNEASMLESAGATAAAGNDDVMLYGSFDQFVIVDRVGTTVELVPHIIGAAQRPTGQRGLILWFRTGSDAVVDNAFRLLTA